MACVITLTKYCAVSSLVSEGSRIIAYTLWKSTIISDIR